MMTAFDNPLDASAPPRELVFVLHGFASGRLVMWPLVRRLERAGYRVRNWGYPSVLRRTEDHARRLHEALRRADASAEVDRIHLVAHSMGGIVARRALQLGPIARLGRLVMLAPPNGGSRAANPWASSLGRIIRPIAELSEREDSYVNRLPPPEGVEFGVLAASADHMVRRGRTHLAGQRDHLVIPALHTVLALRRATALQVIAFLRQGHFERSR